ncbi:hypothetical protein FKV68_26600 (plasmid) [Sinorhizobium mexicanum]|uniref:Uncharacterized protein n=1 Tax=Sinorhizobium mexicanum TaxID=375549 RepID=A0A859QNI6_9HYPH|nr:hypothetical protein FKV68_26600 [Sinorhizobium mexicanum]
MPTTEPDLQRRASYQARKGRCGTLNCCMSLSLNRRRFKETCSRSASKSLARGAPAGFRPSTALVA